MSTNTLGAVEPRLRSAIKPPSDWWRTGIPLAVALLLAVLPAPPGLAQHAWYYFAVFAGVIAALITQPVPNSAVGLIGLTSAAALSRWVLFSPAELAKPGFNVVTQSVNWALSGFGNSTVWLIGGAFMFALGYEKTGLGRRIALLLVRALGKRTLTLGYAIAFADTVLAPFTPSNIARCAGVIFPMVNSLPARYGSHPHDRSARKIGGYLMWTAFAADCVNSTLFMTACAPNFMNRAFAKQIVHVTFGYREWMRATLPFALPLLLAVPLLTYWIFPPEIKRSPEASNWARTELKEIGRITRNEVVLALLVLSAIVMWVFGGNIIDPSLAALAVVSLMMVFGIVTWNDLARNDSAWTTIVLMATLLTLADGLARAGFVKWFADYAATQVGGLSPTLILVALVTIYYLSHYMFASLVAHTTAMMPMMLAAGLAIPGLSPLKLAMGLAMTSGLMGVITPYATGAALPYYNSGYLTPTQFWRLGGIFGLIYLVALLGIGLPLLPE